ncbi:polysaccharide biosynthesis protein [Thalassobius vesicularis]|uniref:Polysaccharide biosynthesis protein n=1 Tax=Thalassobius vesicularis TaxID=1294297 RepID=A0A4S3M8E7_9RHOB|nr:nucleoside-diphosphate sugar epimerase/dehydratase [Thalassobius vesicularis]THD73841.1 polysaccharide biosynthesis protein [Thalassobius vesicularis]
MRRKIDLYALVTSLTSHKKAQLFVLIDALLIIACFGLAALLFGEKFNEIHTVRNGSILLTFLVALGSATSVLLGLPNIRLNAFETGGVKPAAILTVILSVAGLAVNIVLDSPFAPATFTVFGMMFLIGVVATRNLMRNVLLSVYRRAKNRTRVIVYGAGQTGQQLAAALRTDDAVVLVAFVDDNPRLQSLNVSGAPVFAPSHLKELIAEKAVDRVVLAMPSATAAVQARIAVRLRQMGCEVHSLPSFAELIERKELRKRTTPVSLDDLLGRNKLESELPEVADSYHARCILITGAGGSIGSELCRQLVACRPDKLVLMDHSELALYTIEKELQDLDLTQNITIEPVLGSVTDPILCANVLAKHKVEVVLHAAAYKHVPMVEKNQIAGLRNNVLGTKTIADAAYKARVSRFILVSSDKAVRPTNVMGASKRLAELIVQDLATRSESTRFSMVRFGNVLGSSGSVIPLFEEQIARGGPVTLTHNDVARYFMTISEAARLVLLAGSYSRGGDLFVLDMGELVPIRKLARQMIEGAGYSVMDKHNPEGDIEIVVTGLRPGEKLIEELLISPDMLTTPHPKIMRAQETYLSELEMANALRDLRAAIDADDELAAQAVINRWVEKTREQTREPLQIS